MTDKKKTKKHIKGEEVDTKDKISKKKEDKVKTIEEMETKLKSVQEEAKQTYDRLLRVSAEFENYKKRSAREMAEFKKFSNESLLKEMLPVVDNLERAINSSRDDKTANNSLIEGVDITLKDILKVFEKFGVKQVESLGKTFDPNFHHAVMQEETGDHPKNTVLKELQTGYIMHDRLLRPAMVVVSTEKVKSGGEKE